MSNNEDTRNNKPVNKSYTDKMNEFVMSLQIIKDCLQLYLQQGKPHQVIPLSGQLRALLVDTNKDTRDPVLFDLADKNNCSTEIYYFDNTELYNGVIEGSTMILASMQPSVSRISIDQKCIHFKEWLNCNAIQIEGKYYDITTMIKNYADKAGGAHYDPSYKEYFIKARSLKINGAPILDQLIISVAQIAYEVGIEIIRRACCLDMYFSLAINSKQSISDFGCIFEFTDPTSLMCFKLLVDSLLRLNLIITNSDGMGASVITKNIVNWEESHIVNVSIEITKLLETEISIYIDGVKYGGERIDYPIFVLVFIEYYNRFYNCDSQNLLKPIDFGIGSMIYYDRILDLFDKNSVYCVIYESASSNEYKCSSFINGIIAKGFKGNKDIVFVNNDQQIWSLEKIAKGELPEKT